MSIEFIENILTKRDVDVEYWMFHFKKFSDNDWFEPNNKNDESFTIANHMHDFGLLEMKRIPKWNNGSFQGFKIQFKKLQS